MSKEVVLLEAVLDHFSDILEVLKDTKDIRKFLVKLKLNKKKGIGVILEKTKNLVDSLHNHSTKVKDEFYKQYTVLDDISSEKEDNEDNLGTDESIDHTNEQNINEEEGSKESTEKTPDIHHTTSGNNIRERGTLNKTKCDLECASTENEIMDINSSDRPKKNIEEKGTKTSEKTANTNHITNENNIADDHTSNDTANTSATTKEGNMESTSEEDEIMNINSPGNSPDSPQKITENDSGDTTIEETNDLCESIANNDPLNHTSKDTANTSATTKESNMESTTVEDKIVNINSPENNPDSPQKVIENDSGDTTMEETNDLCESIAEDDPLEDTAVPQSIGTNELDNDKENMNSEKNCSSEDKKKGSENTEENENRKGVIRLVDLSKLIEPKSKKSVKFDSSVIILSSDEEVKSPKKNNYTKNNILKSMLKKTKSQKTEVIGNEDIKENSGNLSHKSHRNHRSSRNKHNDSDSVQSEKAALDSVVPGDIAKKSKSTKCKELRSKRNLPGGNESSDSDVVEVCSQNISKTNNRKTKLKQKSNYNDSSSDSEASDDEPLKKKKIEKFKSIKNSDSENSLVISDCEEDKNKKDECSPGNSRKSSRVSRYKDLKEKARQKLKTIFKRKSFGKSNFEIIRGKSKYKEDSDSDSASKSTKKGKKLQKKKDILEYKLTLSNSSTEEETEFWKVKDHKTKKNRSKSNVLCTTPNTDDLKFTYKVYIPLPLIECDKLQEIYLTNKEILEIKRLTNLKSLRNSKRSHSTKNDSNSSSENEKPRKKKSKNKPKKSFSSDLEQSSTDENCEKLTEDIDSAEKTIVEKEAANEDQEMADIIMDKLNQSDVEVDKSSNGSGSSDSEEENKKSKSNNKKVNDKKKSKEETSTGNQTKKDDECKDSDDDENKKKHDKSKDSDDENKKDNTDKDTSDDESKKKDDKSKDSDDENKKDSTDKDTSDDESKKKDKSKTDSDEQKSDDSDDERRKEKKKWRKDKLLTAKIDSTDSEEELKKYRKKKENSEEDTRKIRKIAKKVVISDSDESDTGKKKRTGGSTDEDSSDEEKSSSNESEPKEASKKNPSRRRIKRTKDSSSDEDDDKSTRKQIRRVIGKDALSDSTKQAEAEEKERKARIAEKQRKYNSIFEAKADSETKELVLDYDEDKKEELLSVSKKIVKKLKPHQAKGVQFMWDACFESLERTQTTKGSGCILAHCMGLGKTLQVVALAHTLLTNSDKTGVHKIMVVCPINIVLNWKAEFKQWLPKGHNIEVYELVSARRNYERQCIVQDWHTDGGVLMIGYQMFRNISNPDNKKLSKKMRAAFKEGLVDPGPDLVVCDEGHLLKNEKTSLSIAMNRIKTARRIVLTGTPLQNNLKEYWCMVQFIKPNLLGTYKEYLNRFVNPITNGQYTDSTQRDTLLMRKRSHVLHKLLDGVVQRRDYAVLEPYLPPKHEYVLFVQLTKVQVKLYDYYMEKLAKKNDGSNKTSFLFTDFQQLQRICSHPRILLDKSNERKDKFDDEEDSEGSLKDFIDDGNDSSDSSSKSSAKSNDNSDDSSTNKKKSQKRMRLTRSVAAQKRDNNEESDSDVEEIVKKEWFQEFCDGEELDNIGNSGKLFLLFQILKECEEIGDKVLVFSQSLYTLNCIEYFLEKVDEATQNGNTEKVGEFKSSWAIGLDYFRLDGSSSCDNRAIWCNMFNNPDNIRARLFLISTKAGGLGINLVAANRVIIFDVSWNPSHDIQSIYRVYRFGQTKPCYIYRFVTYGTMEMKIYERQVTKQAISKRVIDEQQIDRHYNQNDLQELYQCDLDPQDRPIPLVPKDVLLGEMLQKYDKTIYKYHLHQSLLENKEDEGLNEEERKAAWDEFENEKVLRKSTMNTVGPNNSAMNAQAIEAALTNIVRKDNPTWSDVQVKGIIPALVQQLRVQLSDGDMTMYTRVQQELQIMQAQAQKLREVYFQQQVMRMIQHQQDQAKLLGNMNINPVHLVRSQPNMVGNLRGPAPRQGSSSSGQQRPNANDVIELND